MERRWIPVPRVHGGRLYAGITGVGAGMMGGGFCGAGSVTRRATTRSLFQKSDLSENWAFWIPAFAGMTDLGAIFHILAREVVGNRLGILGINHR